MTNPFEIGGVDYYDPTACLQLRNELIQMRDATLGPAVFDAKAAVILSHTIGLLGAFIMNKWPETEAIIRGQK